MALDLAASQRRNLASETLQNGETFIFPCSQMVTVGSGSSSGDVRGRKLWALVTLVAFCDTFKS